MKPWQLGDGDNTVATEQLRMEFIFDSINRQLAAIGVTDQTTFDAFANYIGYSTGGTPAYQDMQVAWTPTNEKLGEELGFFTYGPIPNITSLTFNQATSLAGFDIESFPDLLTISFPSLASIDPANTQGGFFSVTSNSVLESVDAPLLTVIAGGISITQNTLLTLINLPLWTGTLGPLGIAGASLSGNTSLTTMSFPELVTVNGDFNASSCTLLSDVSLPKFLPTNGRLHDFRDCALTDASVNHLLARAVASAGFVSGLLGGAGIDLSGGTNAAPSGQGIIDKGVLNARQVGLAVTN